MTVTFDDEAATDLPAAGLQSGTYRPRDVDGILGEDVFPAPAPAASSAGSALSAFDGQAAERGSGRCSWSTTATGTGATALGAFRHHHGDDGVPLDDPGVRRDRSGHRPACRVRRLKHTHSSDIDVTLVGPRGQQVTLLSDVGAAAPVTDVDLVLRDDAPVEAGPALVSGTYRPTNLEGIGTDFYGPAPAPGPIDETSLSAFDGTDPNGVWRLYVGDDREFGDRGILGGWSLEIVTPDGPVVVTPTPQPAPADTIAPRVTRTTPAARAKKVRRGATVLATLSEIVRAATVARATAYLVAKGSTKHVRATVGYRGGVVVIDPSASCASTRRTGW